MTDGVVRYRRKPDIKAAGGIVAAKYEAGGSLEPVARVAAMAFWGEVAECTFPSGETVLIARYFPGAPDDHSPRRDYTTVRDGHWLCYSEGYANLVEDTASNIAYWYEPEEDSHDTPQER